MSSPHRSIGQVLDLLKDEFKDISISKIRFLESQGLIDPDRTKSGYRKFTEADVNRLRWILEQQRDHFLPLKVIKELIDTKDFGASLAEEQFAEPQLSRDVPKASTRRKPTRNTLKTSERASRSKPSSNARNLSPQETSKRTAKGAIGGTIGPLTVDELVAASGLLVGRISELEQFGLIEKIDNGHNLHYSPEAVIVAKTVAAFLNQHGVEPRHLRIYKTAVEHEADLLERRIRPLAMLHTQSARHKCQDMLEELIDLGSELRLSLLRMALANHTQNP
ncbi:MAG: MerR family transcriptional regulator [Acidimicrobiia bacterium]|nr:MerR family transcriptional regulator [Acidimicrobiia bacterium]MYC58534.1 MerR family transcriptional regulator [Acidimicrobiia bacterium]MYG94292.1 MerR family transcriptional regulator [Acidimicrobiia bacterium]MYI30359.1 MerR family transcriptional regulator [Acidimicrobiia bacterium]